MTSEVEGYHPPPRASCRRSAGVRRDRRLRRGGSAPTGRSSSPGGRRVRPSRPAPLVAPGASRRSRTTGGGRVRVAHVLDQPAVDDLEDAVRLLGDAAVVGHDEEGRAQLGVDPAEEARRRPPMLAVSRLPVGSSASTRGGRFMSARAIATRCFWPPESWFAFLPSTPARPSRPSTSSARCRCSAARLAAAGDQRRHEHVLEHAELRQQVVELEDEADVLGCAARRGRGGRRRRRPRPSTRTRPSVGVSSRPIRFSSVDLPGARLADDRGELAGPDLERHVVEGPELHLRRRSPWPGRPL